MMGNKIEVGDTIVYTSDRGYPTLTVGVVLEVDGHSAKISRQHTGETYQGVKNGVWTKHKWNKDYTSQIEITVKARNTRIGFAERCLITRKYYEVRAHVDMAAGDVIPGGMQVHGL